MAIQSKVAKFVKTTMAFAAGSAVFSAPTAFAQEESAEVERVEVTGSRIKRVDMETASPVTVIDASAIKATGATSIDDVLRKMTASSGAMTNAAVNNGSGGKATINLRGLGANRTLVLVNGRRMIASGTGAASTVDLNTIPVSMIQRVEVLKDGASAVYGTDAVAGVVNIILRRDFEGLEMNIQSGVTGHGDAPESSIDFTLGHTFDRGNVVINAQYTKRGEASQADRDFSSCPIAESGGTTFCAGSSYSEGGHIWGDAMFDVTLTGTNSDGDVVPAVGDQGYYGKYVEARDADGVIDATKAPVFKTWGALADESSSYYDATVTEELAARKPANHSGLGDVYHPFTNEDRYNYAADSYLSTPMERINLTFAGTYDLTDDMTFFTEAMYTKRWSEQQMAPQPIWNPSTWVYNPKSAGGWMTDNLVGIVQPGEGISYGRRMVESGTRDFAQTVDTVRLVVGLEGEIGDYTWDVSYNKGRNDSVDTLANLHNLGSINDAVLEGSFDPFDQESWRGDSITPFIYTELNAGQTTLDVFQATLAGEIMELPAGPLGFAAGYEWRKESAAYTPDSLTAQGLANDPPVDPTAGEFDVNEAYAEFAIPLLADLPLAQNVDLSAAIRYFDYSTFGDDNTWKLGLTWRVNDDLMIRGNKATAFRAPTVSELYAGNSPSFDYIKHPATTQDQAVVTVGGNELLTPETADNTTFGLVYNPSFVEGLSLTVDYYDIAIKNTITAVDSNYIANQCLDANGAKINTGTALCQSAGIEMDQTGRISFFNGLQNVGATNTNGIDANIAYNFEAAGLDWRASLDTTFLNKYEELDQDGVAIDYLGYITGNAGSFAKLKSNFTLTANAEDWSANYEMRYIGEMEDFACRTNPSACLAPSVPSIVYHSVSGSVHVTDSINISGGINNLLDQTPPYFTGYNDSNTDPYTYDVLGRYFYLKAGFKF
ncbi:TonB-dependent receptor [Paraferrimonas sp. SM1919]|uniref:TonB-dependent receptor n=1 Tax=Paraferrimonas sp. SM1919 TaxID=2662263 RepID=UPI0013D7A714|nr:TonB-dependent receptor [Paraferrimonas sp. SM1919]